LILLLATAIDAVRRPSPQVVVGIAHPTKKLTQTNLETGFLTRIKWQNPEFWLLFPISA